MRKSHLAISALVLSVALSATGHADSYDYEIGISYDGTRASRETTFLNPVAPIETISFETNSDDDEIGFAGTWFFDGVTASTGPRTRAAFIGRASSVSLHYARSDGDTVLPSARIERSTNSFSANLRWVWSESGWYGLAGLARADTETDNEFTLNDRIADAYYGGSSQDEPGNTDLDQYNFGVGVNFRF